MLDSSWTNLLSEWVSKAGMDFISPVSAQPKRRHVYRRKIKAKIIVTLSSTLVNSKHEWRKWPLNTIFTFFVMLFCLACKSLSENWYICANKGVTYLLLACSPGERCDIDSSLSCRVLNSHHINACKLHSFCCINDPLHIFFLLFFFFIFWVDQRVQLIDRVRLSTAFVFWSLVAETGYDLSWLASLSFFAFIENHNNLLWF